MQTKWKSHAKPFQKKMVAFNREKDIRKRKEKNLQIPLFTGILPVCNTGADSKSDVGCLMFDA